jgi:hypothetical protein
MRLSILPSDNAVYLNGVCYSDIDMSWIPKFNEVDIHAVQWYENHGEVELVTTDPNIEITELGIFEKSVELWEEKHQEYLQKQKQFEAEQLRIEEESNRIRKLEEESIVSINDNLYYDIEELLKEI